MGGMTDVIDRKGRLLLRSRRERWILEETDIGDEEGGFNYLERGIKKVHIISFVEAARVFICNFYSFRTSCVIFVILQVDQESVTSPHFQRLPSLNELFTPKLGRDPCSLTRDCRTSP